MKKIIDDNQLLEMTQKGILQKDIAKFFGVSAVAVCKRLKRLSPQPEVIFNKYNLADKEKIFVLEKVKGKTNTQAAISSYEVSSMESAKVIGSELMSKLSVRNAIGELLEARGGGRIARISKLIEHMSHPDPVISLKALDIGFKLSGDEAEGKRVNLETPVVKTELDMTRYANFVTKK